ATELPTCCSCDSLTSVACRGVVTRTKILGILGQFSDKYVPPILIEKRNFVDKFWSKELQRIYQFGELKLLACDNENAYFVKISKDARRM
ncbi:3370_t:CDS:2, partial [Diversispora eburnea]